MDSDLCYFCGGETNCQSSVCHECLAKVELDLSLPNGEHCPCGSQTNLVVVKFDGGKKSFCTQHLPPAMAIVLAKKLSKSYGYMNAPSVYGNFETFTYVEKFPIFPTRENIDLLVKVINKFNQHQIQYV